MTLRRTIQNIIDVTAVFAIVTFGLTVIPAAARAASWQPNRPIELIVGTDPGSGFDRTARVLQKIWQTTHLVAQTVTVVNKPGGYGAVGWDYMNQRGRAGNDIAIISVLLLTNHITGNMALSYHDVTPLALLEDEQIAVAVYSGSPIKTGQDFIARLRKDPTSVSIGVSGIGGQNHLAVALVAQKAGGIDISKLKVVGFQGSGDVVTAVIGGHVEATASPASTVAPQIAAGRMRGIGVLSEARLSGPLADTPTWREQGIDAVFANWRGVVGPKNMPAEQVQYWNDILAKTVATQEWKDEVRREQLTAHYLDAPATLAFLDDENKTLTDLMGRLGLAK